MRYLNYTIIIIFVFLVCSAAVSSGKDVYVRVAILKDAELAEVSVDAGYQVLDSDNRVIYKGNNLKTKVFSRAEGLDIVKLGVKAPKVVIKPKNYDAIRVNGRRFRGEAWLINKESGLLVINYLKLEDYLKGVLYHEISHYWPIEAIKAQAVVSRTFAFYQATANKDKEYDLTADIYSQVYGGRTSERYRTSKAVDLTRGVVVKFKGKIFPAYFHATCAGLTEDASRLWNIDIPPLKGVVCRYCKDSPHFNWHYNLPLKSIISSLSKAGHNIGEIKDIVIKDRNNSGRIDSLEIITDKETIKISAKDFRNLIGPNIIRSTNFSVKVDNDNAYFEGIGWGHGVGLCQWGAYFMAKSHARYEDIIKYYYPGAQIERIY